MIRGTRRAAILMMLCFICFKEMAAFGEPAQGVHCAVPSTTLTETLEACKRDEDRAQTSNNDAITGLERVKTSGTVQTELGIRNQSSCAGDIPCVWLSQEESTALHKAALHVQPRHDNATEVGDFGKAAVAAFVQSLKPGTLQRLQQLKGETASVVKNLPIDWGDEDLLPTDGSGRSTKRNQVSEVGIFSLASILDTKVQDVGDLEPSYSTGVVHDGFAHKAKGAAIGSSDPQSLHSDMSYRPDNRDVPDYLALVCLSPGSRKAVPTRLLANHHVVELLSDDVKDILRQPLFDVNRPGSVSANGWAARVSATNAVKKPLLYDLSYPYIATRVFSAHVTPTTPEAAEAYKVLLRTIDTAEDNADMEVFLEKGDVLLFANKENLHARAVVSKDQGPLYNGKDRYYQRAYFVRASDCPSEQGRLPNSLPES